MREYMENDKNTVKKIVCNQCGKSLQVENGIVRKVCSEGWPAGDSFLKRMERFMILICAKPVMTGWPVLSGFL